MVLWNVFGAVCCGCWVLWCCGAACVLLCGVTCYIMLSVLWGDVGAGGVVLCSVV